MPLSQNRGFEIIMILSGMAESYNLLQLTGCFSPQCLLARWKVFVLYFTQSVVCCCIFGQQTSSCHLLIAMRHLNHIIGITRYIVNVKAA
jgi:hypothetical protein